MRRARSCFVYSGVTLCGIYLQYRFWGVRAHWFNVIQLISTNDALEKFEIQSWRLLRRAYFILVCDWLRRQAISLIET